MPSTKTSISHPIRVDWLETPWTGRVGLTFAPGKKDPHSHSGPWDRDLRADLERLRDTFAVRRLVCLVEDHELALLGIDGLPTEAASAGIEFHRLPIVDVSIPSDDAAVREMVSDIVLWAQAGDNVVIHCRGGLGRTGTIGGCVLRQAGLNTEQAIRHLAEIRAPNCPETREQRDYIRQFEPAPAVRSRVAGAVLGAAIGDALGHPTEFLQHEGIVQKWPPSGVTGYELWWERDGRRFAPYTDDTQMAEIVLRSLVDEGFHDDSFDRAMTAIAAGFAEWRSKPQGGHRAPGNACMAGAGRLVQGSPWREAGPATAGGCGSVMRAYPFGLLLGADRAERWAVEHSYMTHGHPWALAACAAMAVGVANEMAGDAPQTTVLAMAEAAGRYSAETSAMITEASTLAENGAAHIEVLRRWQGWAAHEAIAAAVFVVCRHPNDIRAALLEGANASGDSDSIATLAGALLGARHGIGALPANWVRDVERSSELLELATEAAALLPAT